MCFVTFDTMISNNNQIKCLYNAITGELMELQPSHQIKCLQSEFSHLIMLMDLQAEKEPWSQAMEPWEVVIMETLHSGGIRTIQ